MSRHSFSSGRVYIVWSMLRMGCKISFTVDCHAEAVSQADRALGECGQADDTPAKYADGTWVAWTRTPPRSFQSSATYEGALEVEVIGT
jgi:hypothetical protein